ncbi:MAG: hypothetical protein KGL39_09865 [Patescibacteria group bacterium]|nr:hypothetical protein [Patescibacteria group bacterium]
MTTQSDALLLSLETMIRMHALLKSAVKVEQAARAFHAALSQKQGKGYLAEYHNLGLALANYTCIVEALQTTSKQPDSNVIPIRGDKNV